MSDIFISYASEDRARAQMLAQTLESEGWSTFWDRTIPVGMTWRQVIGKELAEARCVVVLWSQASIDSTWVQEEAEEGQKREILIPILIEDVLPPLGFRGVQAGDLSDWDGTQTTPVFQRLVSGIARVIGPPPREAEEQEHRKPEEQARREAEERERAEEEAQRKAAEAAERERGAAQAQRKTEEKTDRPKPPPKARGIPARRGMWFAVAAVALLAVAGTWAGYQSSEQQRLEEAEKVAEQQRLEEEKRRAVVVAEQRRLEEEKRRAAVVAEQRRLEEEKRRAAVVAEQRRLEEEKRRAAEASARKTLAVGETFRDCPACPKMIVVPAGHFMMGSPDSESDAAADERPQHPVTIVQAFAIGRYEVTFEEWDACVAEGGCEGHRPGDWGWGRGLRPVIHVTWDHAQAYVKWLGKKTSKPYRLPSEAEWEYAARAGSTARYWWRDDIGRNNANCDGCGSRWDDKQTAPRGSFGPNDFGLYDTAGNVWEWVEDCWNKSYRGAPSDGSAWLGGRCSSRVFRGGSWDDGPGFMRSANRGRSSSDSRYISLGFRVARTLP